MKIDIRVKDEKVLQNAVNRAREKGIVLPTFAQQKDPSLIPEKITAQLKDIGLWDLHPLNLFRITWKNEPKEKGGYGGVNFLEIPPALSGVDARIVMLLGKWFPTGAHKVGAAYGCLAPRLVQGEFDPTQHKAVWPSTGNFCRGGAFDSYLMGCEAIAILPEEMSKERFTWLEELGTHVIATPGSESNVKEIYDKCWELRAESSDYVIFNQFEEWGNAAWHYHTTGAAIEEVYHQIKTDRSRFAAYVSATGSAGTIAAGDYLREVFPLLKVVATEALQCPTLFNNGFGSHRIEGIGDKHVPWIHNVRNTDVVVAVDDVHCMQMLRLFNEEAGRTLLASQGVDEALLGDLDLLGISGICNLISAIKTARYFELNKDDVIFTVATDSVALYGSRIEELQESHGAYSEVHAAMDYRTSQSFNVDFVKELTYYERKAIHNLKYFTWIEQQGREVEELNQLWHEPEIFGHLFSQISRWDELIEEFNRRVGL